MIRLSRGLQGELRHTVVIIAFDRASGKVRGTFVHGSYGGPDPAGVERSRIRFVGEMKDRHRGIDIDTVLLPLDALSGAPIERIDLTTRSPVRSAGTRLPGIERP
jgi:hypothetical protein